MRATESGSNETARPKQLAASHTHRFVGREAELEELRVALDDAVAGNGSAILVSGPPGIGKTRLAEEIAARAGERGMRVAWGRSWEGGGAPAYLALDPNDSRHLRAGGSPSGSNGRPFTAALGFPSNWP